VPEGRSIAQVIEPLRRYLLGWRAYVGLAQTPRVWRELDERMRHRLWTIQLKHWKRGTTMHRELLALGVLGKVVRLVAANSHRWWHNSRLARNKVLTFYLNVNSGYFKVMFEIGEQDGAGF
jgi:RNA-directed DNA polymerase